MSKVNSISFRLGVQRGWDSVWHNSKESFGFLLHQDLLVREYIKGCILRSRYNRVVNEVLIKHTANLSYVHIWLIPRPAFFKKRKYPVSLRCKQNGCQIGDKGLKCKGKIVMCKPQVKVQVKAKAQAKVSRSVAAPFYYKCCRRGAKSLTKSSLRALTTFLRFNVSRIWQKPKKSVRILVHLKQAEELRFDPKMMVNTLRFLMRHQKQKRLTGRRRKTFLNKFIKKKNKKTWRIRSLNGWLYYLLRDRFKKFEYSQNFLRGICLKWSGRFSRGARSRTFVLKRGFIPYQTIVRPIDYCDSALITKFGLVHLQIWVYRTRRASNIDNVKISA